MAKIYGVKIKNETSDKEFSQLIRLLNQEDRDKIMGYRFKKDRDRALIGRLLVKWIFRSEYKINSPLKLHFDHYKRPYQVDVPEVDFNISHSGQWVICGVTDKGKIGVDVEKITDKKNTVHIGKRFFAQSESEILSRLDDYEKKIYFFQIWTLKEAYIKAKRKTFAIPLNSFSFDISQGKSPIFNSNNVQEKNTWLFKSFCIDSNNYWLSVCVHKEDTIEEPLFVNMESWLSSI